MRAADLKPGLIVRGPMLSEPVRIIETADMGETLKLVGEGLESGTVNRLVLARAQLLELEVAPENPGATDAPAEPQLDSPQGIGAVAAAGSEDARSSHPATTLLERGAPQ